MRKKDSIYLFWIIFVQNSSFLLEALVENWLVTLDFFTLTWSCEMTHYILSNVISTI